MRHEAPGSLMLPGDFSSGGGFVYADNSVFYGIIIYLYFFDNQKHHLPHFHARYQGQQAAVSDRAIALGEGQWNRLSV
jgi:hypothetical protein